MDKTVYGNTAGLKKADLALLRGIYDLPVDKDTVLTPELARVIAAVSGGSGRELAVFIDRRGQVVSVGVGDAATVSLQAQGKRRGAYRLAGLRCIHTHPAGSGNLSAADYAALYDLRLDAMAALGLQKDAIKEAYLACLGHRDGQLTRAFQNFGPLSAEQLSQFPLAPLIKELEAAVTPPASIATAAKEQAEKTILVTIDSEDSLAELALLAETAGALPIAQMTQHKQRPDRAFFIGRGKVEELALLRQSLGAELILFDDELNPTQIRNLEKALGCRIADRTALILDIFAQRARSKEGQLQVELAQLQYLLPRLTGQGVALSRLGGGIGTRGPGETKLETDRRHIRRRLEELTAAIEQIRRRRQRQRENRRQSSLPTAALVGYTNAGKSTLLNALTQANAYTADQLFATLDPTTRILELPENKKVLLTDTVGLISKLPHYLVKAFHATLEEVAQADLLLHVADAGHCRLAEQITAVETVLKELSVQDKPTILVLNKIDQPLNRALLEQVKLSCRGRAVEISAQSGVGLDALKDLISQSMPESRRQIKGRLPYSRTDLLALLHRHGEIYSQQYTPGGIQLEAVIDETHLAAVAPYLEHEDDATPG